MNNRVCPDCGEEYSATYRRCPFCEEEAALAHGTPIHRRGGKRVEKRRSSGGAGGVLLLVTGVIIVGVVGYLLLGDRIQDTMGIRDPAPVSDGGDGQDLEDRPVKAQDGEGEPSTVTAPPEEDETEPAPLALNFTTIRIDAGEKGLLSASGGSGGEVVWSSSNEHIATVENGSVTGVAGGDAVITATRGEESVSCTVTVLGDPYVSDLKLKLNKTDFTWGNEDSVQMKVLFQSTNERYDGVVAWASNNTGVVTIDETGSISKVGKGTTTVTATVEGQVLECIVRVH